MQPRLALTLMLVSITSIGVSSAQSEPPTEDFATAKAHRIARLQQELTCIEASTSFETMRACMPPPGGRRGPPPAEK